MVQKQVKRSDQEWLSLIQECRTSGLNDRAWCSEKNIPISTFYNRVSHLRKKACAIPAPSRTGVQPYQQVVPLTVVEENPSSRYHSMQTAEKSLSLPAATLTMNGYRLEINNHADRETVLNIILALQQLC